LKTDFKQTHKIKLFHTTETIKVDGILDEDVWKTTDVAKDFNEIILRDIDKVKRKSEARVVYDNEFIYFSFYSEDTIPYISNTLKRDANPGQNETVWIALDPLNQQTNGFIFALSSYNVQLDDLISANSLNSLSFTWDNKWYSAVKRYNDHWTAEIAIPFKTLRYSKENLEWGINFYRVDIKNAQYGGWTKIPINIHWADLGYYGTLVWDKPPPAPGKNISFIPYTTASYLKNIGNEKTNIKWDAGFDAKVALTPSLNLDFTVNPDFSQVEVDQQVTNLTRFNIFFPERRTFFLENADLYNEIGYPLIRPFYSRTIGLDESGNTIPIIGGVRLSGNINKDYRIALMNIQTAAKEAFAAQNYTALTVRRQVLQRSSISAYLFNRQAFLHDTAKIETPLNAYGRNAGVDARFTSNTTKWRGFTSYNYSFKPGISNKNGYFNIGAEYSVKKIGFQVHYNDVGTNYYADMGFIARINNYDAHLDTVIRLGFKQLFQQVKYRIMPLKGNVNTHLFGVENSLILNPSGTFNNLMNRLRYNLNMKNRSEFQFILERENTRLLFFTKFTNKQPLPPGDYIYNQWNAEYKSDFRKKISYTANYRQGEFYNGTILSGAFSINYRLEHWGNINLGFSYNSIKFPEPFGDAKLYLINPKIEIFFSNNLFWTTFLQYNTQINNININSRIQWRYKPMSDFFLVYTDNYFSDPFLINKNRALVLKLNYWLNL